MSRIAAIPLPLARLDLKARDQRALQIRGCEDPETITRYAEIYRDDPDSMPAIRVVRDPNAASVYWLVDGWHRVKAARKAGRETIQAVVIEGDIRSATLQALGANGDHGLPLTQTERQMACKALLEDAEWQTWSDKRIAAHVHISPQTVAKLRKQVPGAAAAVRESADGKKVTPTNSREKAKAKSRGQEAVAVSVGAATPGTVAQLATALQQNDTSANPTKTRIVAALWLAGQAVDHDTLAALIGERLDVHAGQLRRQGAVHGDRKGWELSPGQINLLTGTRWLKYDGLTRAEYHLTTPGILGEYQPAAPEPEELDPSEATPRPAAATAAPGSAAGPAASSVPAKQDKACAPSKAPIAERRLAALRQIVSERIEAQWGRRSMTERETHALLLVVGLTMESSITTWNDDLLVCAPANFDRQFALDVAEAVSHNRQALPDLHTLCRFWQLDHAALEILAERSVTA
jgi:hypothetical protein